MSGVSQAAIEAASDTFKEQVQRGDTGKAGCTVQEIGGLLSAARCRRRVKASLSVDPASKPDNGRPPVEDAAT